MAWPNPNEYAEAMQNPGAAFSDPDLRKGRVVTNRFGLPRPISGNFATVFEVETGERKQAVRCFLREVTNQQQRYALISAHLKRHPLPWMVDFEYLPQGVRVRGKWYPILKMDWTPGMRLDTYIEKHLDDGRGLFQLAEQWIALCRSLRGAQIAHGDFQHGNILITGSGEIKLIDYDGMVVADGIDLGSAEVGHRHYQHPSRTSDVGVSIANFREIDNFSAHVIGVSLIALSLDASLWKKTEAGEENLLFRDTDYADPRESRTFALLNKHADARIRVLAGAMLQAVRAPSYLDVLPLERNPLDVPQSKVRAWVQERLPFNLSAPNEATVASRPSSWVFDHLDLYPLDFPGDLVAHERMVVEEAFENSIFRRFRPLFREYASFKIAERFSSYPIVVEKSRREEVVHALEVELAGLKDRRKTIARQLNDAEKRFQREIGMLENAIARLTADMEKSHRQEERETRAVDRLLQQLRQDLTTSVIQPGAIGGIGRARVEMLAEIGIRTAADIHPANEIRAKHVLSGVHRANPQRDWDELVRWRQALERRSSPNGAAAVSPDELAHVRARYVEARHRLEAERLERERQRDALMTTSPHVELIGALKAQLDAVDAELNAVGRRYTKARDELNRYARITLRNFIQKVLGSRV